MTYIPESLRQSVAEHAKQKCEYCLFDERYSIYSHEVDHIIPEKHRGETVASNLYYACLDYNWSYLDKMEDVGVSEYLIPRDGDTGKVTTRGNVGDYMGNSTNKS